MKLKKKRNKKTGYRLGNIFISFIQILKQNSEETFNKTRQTGSNIKKLPWKKLPLLGWFYLIFVLIILLLLILFVFPSFYLH